MTYAEGGMIYGGPSDDLVPMMEPGCRIPLTEGEHAIRPDGSIYVWYSATGWTDTGETVDMTAVLNRFKRA